MMLRCLGDPVLGEAVSLEIVIFSGCQHSYIWEEYSKKKIKISGDVDSDLHFILFLICISMYIYILF